MATPIAPALGGGGSIQ